MAHSIVSLPKRMWGRDRSEQLQDETATVVTALHSFQAVVTFKGSLLWIPKGLESITEA